MLISRSGIDTDTTNFELGLYIMSWYVPTICRQVGDDKGRTHEMEQSAVKCMRGILFCYMRQAQKVRLYSMLLMN